MAQQLAIETSGLTKRFGDQKAVNSISLEVPSGSIFGFLGPNGSGKTTTIRMLLGLAEATEGEIRLLGTEIPKDLEKALPRVGALVEGPAFYPFMSGRNNLLRIDAADRFSDASTRIERVESALDRVGLHNAGNKKLHAYSLGMKQRLGLANALLKPRDILVLDEPTNGLDPQGTREVRNLIRSLSAEGITIFLSSHLLSEIEMLCSHVAVMSAGKIIAQGLIEDLRKLAYEFKDNSFIDAVNNLGDFRKNEFKQDKSFHDIGLNKAIENHQLLNSFSNIDVRLCEKEASESLKEFDKINLKQEIAFNDFIETYNSKI